MKRKLLFGMFAAFTMLFTTSCSQDELQPGNNGSETNVRFTLGVEGDAQTRTISDGSGADMLVYAVFDEAGNQIDALKADPKTGVKFPCQVELSLAKGQTYQVAFWAQDQDCKAYNTDNLKAVTIDYDGILNNDETRDAFFYTKKMSIPSGAANKTSETITLKRPFAQLNVGVTEEDWQAAISSTIDIKKSEMTISEVAQTINLLDGSVSGEVTDLTYSLADIPSDILTADVDGDGKKEEFRYLSMSYILPYEVTTGALRTTVSSVEFNFQHKDGNVISLSDGLTNIPVQRNFRTNILGKFLTTVKYDIDINPIAEEAGAMPYPVRCVRNH